MKSYKKRFEELQKVHKEVVEKLQSEIVNITHTGDVWYEREVSSRKQLKGCAEAIAELRSALLLIGEWQKPYRMYEMDHGSRGTQNYFRNIAKKAIQRVDKLREEY